MKLHRFLLLLLMLSSSSLFAGDGARAHLDRFLDGLETLRAEFAQEVIDTETNQVSHSTGVFYLSRPNRFRWVYEGEYPRYIIADGKTIWLVEEDLQQVSQRSQKAVLEGTPAGLFAKKLDLDKEFEVKDVGQRMGLSWLRLRPRSEDSQFEQILLAFEGDKLSRMEMADRLGQVTRFDFFKMQRNLPLQDSLFRFVAPPGYDILDQ
ncbi:outer membrane lipoproteins carrier protein [Thiolapillus brandeum]|uniref:Outer-membrane lipoprotein carrier protein n=2 Tax=Thiolapillus brandeum TaxID=1076588 RepID=A0A7U6JHZ1_9GAMM|nr:outer membrane lipoproteins carrier protein [Thiolapillus brandeum]